MKHEIDYEVLAKSYGWKEDLQGDIGIQLDLQTYLVVDSWEDACIELGLVEKPNV